MANVIPGPAYGMLSAASQFGPYSIAHLSSTANSFQASSSVVNNASASTSNATSFRVPAHKHAHHLHSIPPREKSTRTLIIDHMLWVHARTRFAQARAELGMTDRTGGPRSPHYIHRRRPENYEEEDELGSDGEDAVPLKTRAARRDDEDERLGTQDLPLARSLRLRAEGLEKVVLSMLDQPPPVLPMSEEDVASPSRSPQIKPNQRTGSHPHILPDGVRLRLALSTVINDLFARHIAPLPFPHSQTTPSIPSSALAILPPALSCLSSVSAYSPLVPGYSQSNYPPKTPVKPTARTYTLYMQGAASTANSPPSLRCPRHLHTGCEICVEARSPVRVVTGRGRLGSSPRWLAGMSPDGGGMSGWQDGSGIGSGLSRSAATGSVLRRRLDDSYRQGGKLSSLIPRFLRLSALAASELGREAREEAGIPSPLSPPSPNAPYGGRTYGELSPFGPASASTMHAIQEVQNRLYGLALRPTRQWYMLLAGLLTRAALEGYLTGEWRGTHAVECLLTVGLGIIEGREADGVETEYEEYEPDELPTLADAARMLFPGLRPGAPIRKGEPEAEFETEMDERLRRFYDIPASTPDLSTHMEDLAWQYPAEPVERAAVRFCEAIAKWRGKPELETYKKPGLPSRLRTTPDIGVYFREGLWKRPRDGDEGGSRKRMRV